MMAAPLPSAERARSGRRGAVMREADGRRSRRRCRRDLHAVARLGLRRGIGDGLQRRGRSAARPSRCRGWPHGSRATQLYVDHDAVAEGGVPPRHVQVAAVSTARFGRAALSALFAAVIVERREQAPARVTRPRGAHSWLPAPSAGSEPAFRSTASRAGPSRPTDLAMTCLPNAGAEATSAKLGDARAVGGHVGRRSAADRPASSRCGGSRPSTVRTAGSESPRSAAAPTACRARRDAPRGKSRRRWRRRRAS